MSFLRNQSLRLKLVLILIFPILGLVIFASLQSFDFYKKYNSMEKIETLTILSQKIAQLVHETQKERGFTAGFIGSKGEKFKIELSNQKDISNDKYKEFKSYAKSIDFNTYPNAFKNNINNTIDKFENLNTIRTKVSQLDILSNEAIDYYTNMNSLILNNIKLIAKLSSDAKISREIIAYANFLLSKERAGIERAVGANTLSRNSFDTGMKTKFTNLITAQNIYMGNFLNLSNQNTIEYYKNIMVGQDIKEVNRIREKMLIDSFVDKPEYWFSNISGKINKLKKVDNQLSLNLIKNANLVKEHVYTGLFLTALGSLLSLFFALYLGYSISKNLSKSLSDFIIGLDNFFDFLNYKIDDVQLLVNTDKDEFGNMTKKVNENILKTKENIIQDRKLINETIEVSDKINKGYLDGRISTTSANPALNELKNILNNMIDKLNNIMENIEDVLNSYINLDYRPLVENNNQEGVIEGLINGINTLGDTITEDLIKNKRNGLVLQSSANTLRSNVNNLTNSSNEAAASLEETAAALEEITGTIISNSTSISKMAQYASKVTESASKGEKLAINTMGAMDLINEKVSSINEAITIIDQIAFQTNILSLNAAVEAATAGEAGKGFAVVAQEVRNLATRSAEAAKEIKDIVEIATKEANNGKDITSNMLDGYKGLNIDIEKTIELINSVNESSKEQQNGIEQINDAVTQLDQQTQKNAEAAAKTNDIALSTENLSDTIINEANQKEFRGKDNIESVEEESKHLSYDEKDKKDIEFEIKKNRNLTVQNNSYNNENEAWESF